MKQFLKEFLSTNYKFNICQINDGNCFGFFSDFNTLKELSKMIKKKKRDITFKIADMPKPLLRRAKGILLFSIKGCYTVIGNGYRV